MLSSRKTLAGRALALIAALLVLSASDPVFASTDSTPKKCSGYACRVVDKTSKGLSAEVTDGSLYDNSGTGRGAEVSTVANPCRYAAAEESWDPYVDQVVADYFDSGARWYQVDCTGDGMVYRWFVPGEDDGAGPEALLREVVQAAFGQVDAGVGRLRLAPVDPAPHITGLPSWLAIEPEDFTTRTASVTAGTITVTATLEPRRVMWTLGDGGETSCEGPGTVYDTSRPYESQSTDCTYTYAVASTLDDPDGSYPVAAHIVYGASFTVMSPLAELNGTFDLGELDGPPTSQDIVVRQIQAVRTSG